MQCVWVCVCVCVREREKERECACACVCVYVIGMRHGVSMVCLYSYPVMACDAKLRSM